MYEELGDDDNWAIVRSGVPSDITHTEQEGGNAWRNHMAVGARLRRATPGSWIFFLRRTTTLAS